MAIARARLDRFIGEKCQVSRRDVRLMLAQGRIKVDGQVVDDIGLIINKFSRIEVDDRQLQVSKAVYIKLYKPSGVVCATKDDIHSTVVDLISHPLINELHIVGRLDLNTSGLVLLTNDSRWSESLMSPHRKVAKKYSVTLQKAVTEDYILAFEKGMYFHTEGITTLPAKLTIISKYKAEVELFEGKYHQIKRMFGRFNNPVIGLHRTAIGDYTLDTNMEEGEYRELTKDEIGELPS